jgi:hypothetical protein
MDILAQVLDRVRLGGTLLFHFELGHPWNLALPTPRKAPPPFRTIWPRRSTPRRRPRPSSQR